MPKTASKKNPAQSAGRKKAMSATADSKGQAFAGELHGKKVVSSKRAASAHVAVKTRAGAKKKTKSTVDPAATTKKTGTKRNVKRTPPAQKTALISVADKEHVVQLAAQLQALGYRLLSTGGTAQLLRESRLAVTDVAEVTGFPEMLGGRLKTLHPRVHAGLLARRDEPAHVAALQQHSIAHIDMVVINLYPFEATVSNPKVSLQEAIEQIDIGGPAMVRSAAKNWQDVAVLTDHSQYKEVLEELHTRGFLSRKTKFALAVAAFSRISRYDAAISDFLSSYSLGDDGQFRRTKYPAQSTGCFIKLQDLRYGENPHQDAAFYRDAFPAPGSIVLGEQLHGKALSYNNIADADTAWECVKSFETNACVIVKHATPCGVALADSARQAYLNALQTDKISAFGGVIAFNCEVDLEAAVQLSQLFVEVLIAPDFAAAALDLLASKPSLRILKIALPPQLPGAVIKHAKAHNLELPAWPQGRNAYDLKRVGSGLLIQSADNRVLEKTDLSVVTKRLPTPPILADMLFAWKVVKYVKSNAVVFVKDGKTLAIGAGQVSRVDCVHIAKIKAAKAGLSLEQSVVASDAFFPFRDGVDELASAGAGAVIQPGGSVRDEEVIAAAEEHNIAMAFTGVRHFRH